MSVRWYAILTVLLLAACDGDNRASAPSRPGRPVAADVRCTDNGIAVEGTRFAASADGVHLVVANTTGDDAYLVASPVQENPTMTVPPGTSTVVVLARPGDVDLRCDLWPKGTHRSVTVTVADPNRFYRSVDLAEALGCVPDATVDAHDAAWGSTAREAADSYAAQVEAAGRGEVVITEGNGYRDHERQEFLLFVDGQGYGTLDVYGDVHPDLGDQYRASYGQVCSDRVFPDMPGR